MVINDADDAFAPTEIGSVEGVFYQQSLMFGCAEVTNNDESSLFTGEGARGAIISSLGSYGPLSGYWGCECSMSSVMPN